MMIRAEGPEPRTPTRPAIVVCDLAADRRDLLASLAALEATVRLVGSPQETGSTTPTDVLIVRVDAVPSSEDLACFSSLAERGRLLLSLSGQFPIADYGSIFRMHSISHFVSGRPTQDDVELVAAVRKMLAADPFGISDFFPAGAECTKFSLSSSDERDETVRRMHGHIEDAKVRPRFAEILCAAADEFITNAFYDAPVDAEGQPRLPPDGRRQPVVLLAEERVDVTLCVGGGRIGVAVEDPFGSLQPDTVIRYLDKCFRGGAEQIDRKEHGAGLGMYLAFQSLSHFAINVEAGRRTEMIGLMDVRGSYRDFVARGKSFNVFVSATRAR